MEQNKLTIFSVFHKSYTVPESDFIKPIQVGRELTGIDLGFFADNTGNNISAKNKSFCELTALYWIWQNLESINSRYIGLVHYRRYFTLPLKSKSFYKNFTKIHTYFNPLNAETLRKVASTELKIALLKNLDENKIILPTAYRTFINSEYCANVKDHFIYHHVVEDWYLMKETVLQLYPDYKDSFEKFQKAKKTSGFNMFIGDKVFIREYCSWLFSIIFELEKKVKISEYSYQSRLLGFFSERLLNLFIIHNNLKIAEFPIVMIE